MTEIARFTGQGDRSGSVSGYAPTGSDDVWSALARTSGAIADKLGRQADANVARDFREKGMAAAASVKMPGVDFAFKEGQAGSAGDGGTYVSGAGAKPYKMQDPAAADLPVHARAFLNAVAGGESGGHYNVRFTPRGGVMFGDMSRHPGIMEAGPHGPSSAAGRYQFVKTTWDDLGGGDFSPANQDRRAWTLAQRDYRTATGRNLDADLKEQGLTGAMMDALTPTWQAFKNGQGRHAATYADTLTRLGSSAGTAPSNPTPGAASEASAGSYVPGVEGTKEAAPTISVALAPGGAPPPRMASGTIAGDAYNEAALDIYMGRLETSMAAQMDGLALQHRDDPAALTSALDALRGGYEQDLPPAQRALVAGAFERRKFSLVRGAALDWQQKIESEHKAAFEDTLSSRQDNALRIARRAGTDAEADKALAAEMASIGRSIDGSSLAPAEKSRLKRKLESDVVTERVTGGFENQPDAASRASFAERFQREWQEGNGFGGKVSVDTYDRITASMTRRVEADLAAQEKRGRVVEKEIGGQIDLLKKGYPVPDSRRQALRTAVATTGDEQLGAELEFLDNLASWHSAQIGARPELLDAQIAQLQERMTKEGATPHAVTTLEVMKSLRTEMGSQLRDDPLTWANRAGVVKVEPLDFSSPEKTIASLTERAADAETVAGHYGAEPRYFTPNEKAALTKALEQEPQNLPAIAGALGTAFGRHTPKALKEISKDAPVVAHVAGLQQSTGDQRVSVEVAEALAYRRLDGYKKALPTDAKLGSASSSELSGALARVPDTQSAAIETADVLFEARARRRGIDPADVDVAGSKANALYREALDDALGARVVAGVKMGGLTEVNGYRTVAPTDIPSDDVEDLILNLSDEDLASQAEIKSANSVPINARLLQRGALVSVGDGLYQMALGNPQSFDPRFVMGADGSPWTLDIHRLASSQKKRGAKNTPEAFDISPF